MRTFGLSRGIVLGKEMNRMDVFFAENELSNDIAIR